jgi:hypothetical protein
MDPVLQQQLVDFLKKNLTINSYNTVNPFDDTDNFTVQLILNGEVISQTTLNVNDGSR